MTHDWPEKPLGWRRREFPGGWFGDYEREDKRGYTLSVKPQGRFAAAKVTRGGEVIGTGFGKDFRAAVIKAKRIAGDHYGAKR